MQTEVEIRQRVVIDAAKAWVNGTASHVRLVEAVQALEKIESRPSMDVRREPEV